MKWHFIKVVFRGIKLKKLNTLIKILGIVFALVPMILIFSFIRYEISYDSQFPESEKIFRVIRNWQEDPKFDTNTPVMLLPAMAGVFPEITTGTRIWPINDLEVLANNMCFREEVILSADSTFFKTFGMELISGNKNMVFKENQIVISSSMSLKLFGNVNPMGEIVEFEGGGRISFTVGGVFDDFPSNSHLRGNFILPIYALGIMDEKHPTNHQVVTYMKLYAASDKDQVEQRFPAFLESFYGKDYYDFARTTYLLQPVRDIHMNTGVNYSNYESAKGSMVNLYIYPALALLILMITIFNFINLFVSEGFLMNKSFRVNRIAGAGKYYIYVVFLLEGLVLNFIAFIISMLLLKIISPYFTVFVNREIDFSFISDPKYFILLLSVTSFVGVISGLYPAMYFDRKLVHPNGKDQVFADKKRLAVQRIFQITQFAICIFFIAGSAIVLKQLKFISSSMSKSLDKENVLILKNYHQLENNRYYFKEELLKMAGVISISSCNEVPGIAGYSYWGQPVDSASFDAHIAVYRCDKNYLAALGMQLLDGRFFEPDLYSDSKSIILNETAVKVLGWQNPLGKRYKLGEAYTVIGVVKDIYFDSFHREILPQGLILLPENLGNKLLVKFASGKTQEDLKAINHMWSKYIPDKEMHYSFLNQELDSWYQSERKTGQLAIVLALIAVFLSELGLFAMVLQSVTGRMKEIGIRKVNGAKVLEVLKLLNKDFIIWVAFAFVIITPLAWYIMHHWLKIFVYKTSLSWWIFILAGLLTLVVSLIAASWQTWRAATMNPVEALRYE